MSNFRMGIVITARNRAGATLHSIETGLGRIEKRSKRIGKSMSWAGAKFTAVATGMGASMVGLVRKFDEVEQAKGEVASLGVGELGLAKIGKEAQRFSNEFAGVTKSQFIRASYDIKSGISSLSDEGVAKFTRLAAMTAIATKSSTADMSKLFAMGYGIYRSQFSSDFEFGEKFSAAISTAVRAFRTDGGDLISGLSTLGAVATKNGVSLQEQLAILGVSKDAFSSASEAATSYRAFLQGAGKAQKELGLRFTDSKGRLLPMADILDKIKKKYGDLSKRSVQDKLKKAFGSDEAVKILLALIDKTNRLRHAQDDLYQGMQKGTAVTEEMARKMQRGRGFELLLQRIGNAASTIGAIFAPAIRKVSAAIGTATIKLQGWIDQHPKEAHWLGKVALGVTVLTGVLGGLGLTIGMASFAFGGLAKGAGAVIGSLRLVGGAIAFMGRALLMNPIGLAVTVIAGGAYLIYRHWSKVGPFFSRLWSGVKNVFSQAWNSIKSLATAPIEWIVAKWRSFTTTFTALFPGVSAKIKTTWHRIGQAMTVPITWIKQKWQGLLDWFSGKFEWLSKKFAWIGKGWEKAKSFGTKIGSSVGETVSGWWKGAKEWFGGDETPKPSKVVKHVVIGATAATTVATSTPHPAAQPSSRPTGQNAITAPTRPISPSPRPQGSGIASALQSQYQALAATVQALASRPEQHVYHVQVTVNNPRNDAEIEAIVERALRRAHYERAQRTMHDL